MTGGNSEQDGARNVALDQLISSSRYRRLMLIMGFGILAVAVAPLLIMTGVNLNQYRDAFHTELVRPMVQLTSNAKHSLEFFLAERQSALEMVIRDQSYDELADARRLQRTLSDYLASSWAGVWQVADVHGGGSPAMETIAILGNYDFDERKRIIKRLAGIDD